MIFNNHSNLEGTHAFLGASKCAWLNYDKEHLWDAYLRSFAPRIGTILHATACNLIRFAIKLSKTDKKLILYDLLKEEIPREAIDIDKYFPNFMNYVNDAIGFRMTPEVTLVYSDRCYGTADAISFENNFLRIHDLKTGDTAAKMEQLYVYAALFCLEYKIRPADIQFELRIYQGNEILYDNPTSETILPIMNTIVEDDKFLRHLKEEA